MSRFFVATLLGAAAATADTEININFNGLMAGMRGGGDGMGDGMGGGPDECEECPEDMNSKTMEQVRNRGHLKCGVSGTSQLFSNDNGQASNHAGYTGFDVHFCRAIAAAIFGAGGANMVEFVQVSGADRLSKLNEGEFDVLSRTTTRNFRREVGYAPDGANTGVDFTTTPYYYEGTAVVANDSLGFTDVSQLNDASVVFCIAEGLTWADIARSRFPMATVFSAGIMNTPDTIAAYNNGDCNAMPLQTPSISGALSQVTGSSRLAGAFGSEALHQAVRRGDNQWRLAMSWIIDGLILAEEFGINRANVDSFVPQGAEQMRLLGHEADGSDFNAGMHVGLHKYAIRWALAQVGSFGDIYADTLESADPRTGSPNAHALMGGLIRSGRW